jgi:fucose permease
MHARISSIVAVYLAGLLQGMILVSFPASSAVLRAQHGFTDARYGLIFLPQVVFAVIGALCGGALVPRIGLQRLLWIALLANGLSQSALAGVSWAPAALAYPLLLAGTGCLGLGFGLLGAPMNTYPQRLFAARAGTAVVAMHTLVGFGSMVCPVLVDAAAAANRWIAVPATLAMLALLLAGAAAWLPLGGEPERPLATAERSLEPPPVNAAAFWLFAAIAVIYAFAEGTFSNWAVIFLHDAKGLPASTAALGLSAFWGSLVTGRLLISALLLRVPARTIWIALPALIGAAFLLLPYADTPLRGVGLFGFAGLACSAFFPLSVALVSARFPQHIAWVSSMMIAALVGGTGLGSFVLGALRSALSFDALYRWSALYPAAVLLLAAVLWSSGGLRQAKAS